MAPAALPTRKRKPGRPATASAEDEVASRRRRLRNGNSSINNSRDKSPEQPEQGDERPQKRTRKGKENAVHVESGAEAPRANARGRLRRPGRPSAGDKGSREESAHEADHEESVAPPKKGRPPKNSTGANREEKQALSRDKHDRQSDRLQKGEGPSGEPQGNASQPSGRPKKRGRPEEEPQPNKRRRSSRGQPTEEDETPRPTKRSNRRKNVVDDEDAAEQEEPSVSQPKKRRRQAEKDQEEPDQEGPDQEESISKKGSTRRPRKSKQSEEQPEREGASEDEEPVEEEEPDHQGLVPQINSVSKQTIKTKWSPLDGPSIAIVTNLLHDAARPVLLRLKDEKKRALAASALQTISSRLRTKMAKGLPFPPASTAFKKKSGRRKGVYKNNNNEEEGENRVNELSFETVVDGVRASQQRLTPLLHSIALLKRERDNQERQLKWDYQNLQQLERNARQQKNTWRVQLRKGHPFVPGPKDERKHDSDGNGNDDDDDYGMSRRPMHGMELLPADKVAGMAFRDIDDPELLKLAYQANSHMDSITGNLQQIDGVVPAIDRTRAALQGVLYAHLDAKAYEHVMLG